MTDPCTNCDENCGEHCEYYTRPPNCPNCGKPLYLVHWKEGATYDFDPKTDSYVVRELYGGVGYTSCAVCEYQLNRMPEFEEGPLNFKHLVEETGYMCVCDEPESVKTIHEGNLFDEIVQHCAKCGGFIEN